ncbi:unnamed protein product [Ambrosiozyma monospora]|uniref:Unnamed protein product n=1 Tax=Ambrosiozyma monospora TaxID=43982 RepID=A0ACB5SSI9_AMBMO|nr:unnamed protein product [Ambrosiozyma monospora]
MLLLMVPNSMAPERTLSTMGHFNTSGRSNLSTQNLTVFKFAHRHSSKTGVDRAAIKKKIWKDQYQTSDNFEANNNQEVDFGRVTEEDAVNLNKELNFGGSAEQRFGNFLERVAEAALESDDDNIGGTLPITSFDTPETKSLMEAIGFLFASEEAFEVFPDRGVQTIDDDTTLTTTGVVS